MLAAHSNAELSAGVAEGFGVGIWVPRAQSPYDRWLLCILKHRQGMIKNREAIYPEGKNGPCGSYHEIS